MKLCREPGTCFRCGDQPMADHAQVVETKTILPEFAWRIAKHKYPPPTTVGNVKQREDSQPTIGAATSIQEGGTPQPTIGAATSIQEGGTPQPIKRHSLH